MQKLQMHQTEQQLTPREKRIIGFIQNYPGCKSGEIAKVLGIARLTVIRTLSVLIEKNIINKTITVLITI